MVSQIVIQWGPITCLELYLIISFFLDGCEYPNFTWETLERQSKLTRVRKVENWGKDIEPFASPVMNEPMNKQTNFFKLRLQGPPWWSNG